MNLSIFSQEQLGCALLAMRQKALLYEHGGKCYAAARCESLGWWVWELVPGAKERFVSKDYRHCNCGEQPDCIHRQLLRGDHR